MSHKPRRKQRDPVGATNSGAGRRQGRPSAAARPTPPRRPAPDAGWGGLLAAPCCWDSEPQGCGGCFRATRRAQFGRREPALPAPPRRIPTRAPRAPAERGQDADLRALSRPHDPEHVDSRKEGASRLHLQPRWPRHDPLLLRERGHLAKRHQPAVSAPRALAPSANARKVCVSAVTSPTSWEASKEGEIAPCFLRGPGAPGGIVGWRCGVILGGRKCPGVGVDGQNNPLREFLGNFEGRCLW